MLGGTLSERDCLSPKYECEYRRTSHETSTYHLYLGLVAATTAYQQLCHHPKDNSQAICRHRLCGRCYRFDGWRDRVLKERFDGYHWQGISNTPWHNNAHCCPLLPRWRGWICHTTCWLHRKTVINCRVRQQSESRWRWWLSRSRTHGTGEDVTKPIVER